MLEVFQCTELYLQAGKFSLNAVYSRNKFLGAEKIPTFRDTV